MIKPPATAWAVSSSLDVEPGQRIQPAQRLPGRCQFGSLARLSLEGVQGLRHHGDVIGLGRGAGSLPTFVTSCATIRWCLASAAAWTL